MYNSVLLIGRATDKPVVKQLESGVVVGNFVLAVNRPYKNGNGEYDCDFINLTMWNSVASYAEEYIKKGSLVCVKGYLMPREEILNCINEGGEEYKRKVRTVEVYVEKIVFLKL